MRKARKSGGGAFAPAVILGLVLVGVFSFSAFIVLSAFEPELTSGRDGRAHALSQSAVGFAGAVRLARATGATVNIGRTVGDRTRAHSLVIITAERPLSWEDLTKAEGQTTLVILPKWLVGPHPTRRGWVARAGVAPPQAVAALLGQIAPGAVIAHASGATRPRLNAADAKFSPAGSIENLQTMTAPNLVPLITDDAGGVVLARVVHDGQTTNIHVLADPDFLNTHGIADLDNARAGMAMLSYLRPDNEPILFDVTLNGLGSARSALRLAFQPPFLGATLGLVIAAALLGWRAALRFGPSAQIGRAIALGKAALADNSAALIRLAGREHKLGPGYARLTGAVVAEATGFGRKDETETATLLDNMSAAQGASASFSQLSAQAGAAKNSQQMLEAARKLHAWKEEIARATR